MKTIIIFFIMASSCFSQDIGIDSASYKKVHYIINEVLNNSKNLDSLMKFLSDSNYTVSYTQLRFNYENMKASSEKVFKHINENYFRDGFKIELEKNTTEYYHNDWQKVFNVKVRSNKTKDILWFCFEIENGVWKLGSFRYCNNLQGFDYTRPCNKE